MEHKAPFIIQFPSLDDFCSELIEAGLPDTEFVRVWGGNFFVGDNINMPGRRYYAVMCQAIDAPNKILNVCLVIGGYQELGGAPFGPMAQGVHAIVSVNLDEALKLVTAYITEKTGAAIRPGRIETGLTSLTIHKVSWSGFKHIYDQFQGGEP